MEKGRQCTNFHSLKRISITAVWDWPFFRDLQHKKQGRSEFSNKQRRFAQKVCFNRTKLEPLDKVNIKQDFHIIITCAVGKVKILLKPGEYIRNKVTIGYNYTGSDERRLVMQR